MISVTLRPSRPARAALRGWALGLALAASCGCLLAPSASYAFGEPVNFSPPTITGTAQQGNTLTEVHGSWTNSSSRYRYPWFRCDSSGASCVTSYTYQWLRCDSSGASCVTIAGATSQTYVPVAEDVGHELRVWETASNFNGPSGPAESLATAVVVPPVVPPVTPPVVLSRSAVTITRRGEALIQVICPADARGGCRGTVTIQVSKPAARRARALAARCARGCRPLGSAKYEARAGQKIRVRVQIASVGRRLLAQRKAVRVSVIATNVFGGNTTTTALTMTLKAPTLVA